jgi:hypothetical protein
MNIPAFKETTDQGECGHIFAAGPATPNTVHHQARAIGGWMGASRRLRRKKVLSWLLPSKPSFKN